MKLMLLVMCFIFGISAKALAVGNYEDPCRSQNDAFLDSKKVLEACVDRSNLTETEKSKTLSCLTELKDVDEKAKLLHDCRNKFR